MISSMSMASMREELALIKQAEIEPPGGAALGAAAFGPIGAGIGAHLGKRRDRKYHGSPGWRAAGGALLGGSLASALPMALARTPAGVMSAMLAGQAGGILGAYLGASSVRTQRRKPRRRR